MNLLKWFYWPINKLILLRHDYLMKQINYNYIRNIQARRRLEWLLKQKDDR